MIFFCERDASKIFLNYEYDIEKLISKTERIDDESKI